ncbi:hypothetical protein QR680_013523 [Steinernema hermaphroditum]|uniref:Alpha-carbonic anhydrase domain-containing protein n=1 Tax=Steinernema hermaphroditum TaxID=289476 RepID=A0AA39M1P2_9BILA|nr:hypothetical protein QR680_013523 [Steinernema hermaphroditum]
MSPLRLCLFLSLLSAGSGRGEPFEEASYYPWIYDNDLFGGPDFWGLVDKHWTLCSKGKLQSPISIESARLAFDPNLAPLHFDEVTVLSKFRNLGQIPVVSVEAGDFRWPSPNASSGPLRPYRYRLDHIQFHFGRDGKMGSEHALDSNRFPMEIQLVAINTDLYANYSAASRAPHGLAGISVMVELGRQTNEELLKITMATASATFKGMAVDLLDLKPWRLMPKTTEFVTYDGSMTSPGCHETVTWIVFNKPIYITPGHLQAWNALQQTITEEAEPRFTSPNARPLQELNQRILRTNINHKMKSSDGKCHGHKINVAYFSKPKNATVRLSPYHHHKRRHTGHHRSP